MKRIGVLAVALFLACGIAFFATQQQAVRAYESKEWVEFAQWLVKFQKEYANEWELMERFGIFRANKHAIEAHNAEKHNWTKGINQFTDLTIQEFQEQYLNGLVIEDNIQSVEVIPTDGDVADAIDWQAKGAVTPVKNQGQCGSCWSFSSTGAFEGAYFLKHGKLLSFSESQLVDCSRAYGNYGCNGGWPSSAFQYWQEKGVELESDYTYEPYDRVCAYNAAKAIYKVSGQQKSTASETGLKSASSRAVVSVCIDASYWSSYSGGIFSGTCSKTRINHAVTLTGYGTDGGKKYWRIKNSWASSWGEKGYIRLPRTDSTFDVGACAVARYAYVVLAQ